MPLRIPAILVGDSRLGGISQTISAFESLQIRGYDVESILLFEDDHYGNLGYVSDFFRDHHDSILVAGVTLPPEKHRNQQQDIQVMRNYYDKTAEYGTAQEILKHLDQRHTERITSLESMAARAHRNIWYPFTQQSLLKKEAITVIDSAHGDKFQTLVPQVETKVTGVSQSTPTSHRPQGLLQSSFDGSASWWTQGLGHANPKLTLAAAYAAGRYGHVMFAESIHKPALDLAETLLRHIDNPRLTRVFFSDNGSTGIEVAIKMALRATRLRYYKHELKNDSSANEKLGVIGLKGGYHGDTLGAMDSAEPCSFNEKIEWYEGKGFWFGYPTVLCINGRWETVVPNELKERLGCGRQFASLSEIFDVTERESKGEHLVYESFIRDTLKSLHEKGQKFGAVIIEPIVLGAGGMNLV